MIVTKMAIPRRTVLRGLGVTLALPFLDAMVPALTAVRRIAAKPINRLCTLYVPNGIMMDLWTPPTEGAGFEFTPILKALEPFRDRLLVMSGLHSKPASAQPGEVSGPHARPSAAFLTGIHPKQTQGPDLQAGVSIDQIAARHLGQHTQLASLELALESSEFGGSCDIGYSCAYTNTICWRSPTTPLPMEHNPRAVFKQLFGDSSSTDPGLRRARLEKDRSILDSVTDKVSSLERGLGASDRVRFSEYLEAVRDAERRIRRAEEQSSRELTVVETPVGIPSTYDEHAKLMFDLQVLAFQSDLTRIITFMIGRELSGQTYPWIGVPDSHHPISHHAGDREKRAKVAKINAYHVTLLAYYLEKLRSTSDGDGSLLDHVMVLYGSALSDGNRHDNNDLPILLAGGGAGHLSGGRHLRVAGATPLTNLHLTLLHNLGVPHESIGDSTGKFEQLSAVS
jgi:hypothetical protein